MNFCFLNSFLNEMKEKTVTFLLKCILFQTKASNSRVLACILKIGVKGLFPQIGVLPYYSNGIVQKVGAIYCMTKIN